MQSMASFLWPATIHRPVRGRGRRDPRLTFALRRYSVLPADHVQRRDRTNEHFQDKLGLGAQCPSGEAACGQVRTSVSFGWWGYISEITPAIWEVQLCFL